MIKRSVLIAAFAAFAIAPAHAGEYDDSLSSLVDAQLRAVVADADIIAAIKAQNAAHAELTQDEIDALDKEWRAQVGQSPAALIDPILGNDASAKLVAARDAAEGLLTEVFVMDDRGLNVAASDVTSDYWQGDEAKWIETYQVGPDAVHFGDVELDESTQSYQAQVSLSIADPDTGAVIGAATFGVNIEFLE